jgi:hypothetical protein
VVAVSQTTDYPATVRACNRFPCRSSLATWDVGPWSDCVVQSGVGSNMCEVRYGGQVGVRGKRHSAPIALFCSPAAPPPPLPCAYGLPICVCISRRQTRPVRCINGDGVHVANSACVATNGTASEPAAAVACTVSSTCMCRSDADCPGPHWACDNTTHACVCSALWAGDSCDVPLVVPTSKGPCVDGVVDVLGVCCSGFVDSTTGQCCPEDRPVDNSGRCCPTATVDACGVCGGSGVAVDIQGTCCATPLPPSQVCCVQGVLDSCGVCGGDNGCPYVVVVCSGGVGRCRAWGSGRGARCLPHSHSCTRAVQRHHLTLHACCVGPLNVGSAIIAVSLNTSVGSTVTLEDLNTTLRVLQASISSLASSENGTAIVFRYTPGPVPGLSDGALVGRLLGNGSSWAHSVVVRRRAG